MSKNKFFAAIFALRIYRFAQVPNARFGHVQMNLATTLSLRICRLSSKILYLPRMFTGIIQATGEIVSLENRGDALTMRMKSPGFFKNSKLGDSIANNGVCLSVESNTDDEATFCLMHQTVVNTSFKQAKVGDLVNLEYPCRADSFMGGHFVMGHVDCTTEVLRVTPRETGVEVDLALPADLRRYVIRRGSISLNGISLTVAEKGEDFIRVCIIPETLARTNLRNWVPGTVVNVEVDMLGKYIENYLKERDLA